MAEPRPSLIVPVVLIVLVLVGAGVGLGLLYEHNRTPPAAAVPTVALGSNVTVNYIGLFGSGPQAGRVFDTSLYSVATNNLSYPKSLEFAYRGSEAAYTPLPVHVGPSGSYTVDGLTFGTVVPGFWQGMIGLSVNHTVSITVPPNLGYGPVIPGCLVLQRLNYQEPVLAVFTPTQFATAFPGKSSAAGTEFINPIFGWNDLVLSSNSTSIAVENLPTVGWSVPLSVWPIVVTAVNATVISISNELTPSSVGSVVGTDPSATVCGSHRFIVTAVNPTNGTFTELYDYSSSGGSPVNAEIQGQTLVFEVTVVRFY